MQKWCLENQFELNVTKCKAITVSRRKNPIEHVYRIGEHELEGVEEIQGPSSLSGQEAEVFNRCFICITELVSS
jgi:hypothetical protein